MAQLRRGVLAGLGLPVQLSVRDELERETEEGVGEARVLLSHADVHAGVRGVEGADQETSICV